ncbi:hypothetical protein Tco_0070699 [Tanacetum coccineum]
MASQDARLSKFKADFKQQQSEMTNKIDTVLKAITDRLAGSLPSDTVKNPKLSTSPVLAAHSYPTIDPPNAHTQPSTSITTYENMFQTRRRTFPRTSPTANRDRDWNATTKNPNQQIKLNLGFAILPTGFSNSQLTALLYNAILRKYVESLELAKQINILSRRGAIPINLKSNMWESEDLLNNPINWNKPPKMEMEHGMPRLDRLIQTEKSFTYPKTHNQSPPTRKLLREKIQERSSTLDHFYDT